MEQQSSAALSLAGRRRLLTSHNLLPVLWWGLVGPMIAEEASGYPAASNGQGIMAFSWGPGTFTRFEQLETGPGDGTNLVHEVFPGQPMEQAGVLPGDYLIEINGCPIASGLDIFDSTVEIGPREPFDLVVWREGQELVLHGRSGGPGRRSDSRMLANLRASSAEMRQRSILDARRQEQLQRFRRQFDRIEAALADEPRGTRLPGNWTLEIAARTTDLGQTAVQLPPPQGADAGATGHQMRTGEDQSWTLEWSTRLE